MEFIDSSLRNYSYACRIYSRTTFCSLQPHPLSFHHNPLLLCSVKVSPRNCFFALKLYFFPFILCNSNLSICHFYGLWWEGTKVFRVCKRSIRKKKLDKHCFRQFS